MIFDQMEFHNVVELEQRPGMPGYLMHRFPREVREAVNQDVADLCRSVELRFYIEERCAIRGAVYLMARSCDGEAVVFYGDYQQSQIIPLPKGVVTPVEIDLPEAIRELPARRFPNRVCRIFINSRTPVSYIGHEWLRIRPPRAEEKPEKLLVAHGSSITHGGLARSNCNCYVQLAARRLGMDVLNLGMSGSCFAEPEMIDFVAKAGGDAVFLELGANMLSSVPVEEYERRVINALERVARGHAGVPVLATALYPSRYVGEAYRAYEKALSGAVARLALPNLFYEEAWELLPDFTGLSTDGLHPSDWGHMLIGENLAARIQARLDGEV